MTYIPESIDMGLFHWRSRESDTRKEEITAWYRSLTKEQRDYGDDMRSERYEEGWDDGHRRGR